MEEIVKNATITNGFESPPYSVEGFESGWFCVSNSRGFNCLSFADKPGAVFTNHDTAHEICRKFNETSSGSASANKETKCYPN